MASQDVELKKAIDATQPFGFFVNRLDFSINNDFNAVLNKQSLLLGGENSLLAEVVKFQMVKKDENEADLIRFFTEHKVTLSLRPKDDDGLESSASLVASLHLTLAADYKVFSPLDDDCLAILASHCTMVHAYPYAREIIQTTFQRAGIQNVTVPYLGRALTGNTSDNLSARPDSGGADNG